MSNGNFQHFCDIKSNTFWEIYMDCNVYKVKFQNIIQEQVKDLILYKTGKPYFSVVVSKYLNNRGSDTHVKSKTKITD